MVSGTGVWQELGAASAVMDEASCCKWGLLSFISCPKSVLNSRQERLFSRSSDRHRDVRRQEEDRSAKGPIVF